MGKIKAMRLLAKRMFRYFKSEDLYLEAMAIGMNSFVDLEKDEHMLFLDYDVKDYVKVSDSIKELQNFFNLSHAFIYQTEKGFHAFFFYDNELPYSRIQLILNYAKHVDPMFKFIGKYYDHKTIRVAGKYKYQDIKFYDIIKARDPTLAEIKVADMKRAEYTMLRTLHDMFQKDRLKDNEEAK
jgi:hypothetical protein